MQKGQVRHWPQLEALRPRPAGQKEAGSEKPGLEPQRGGCLVGADQGGRVGLSGGGRRSLLSDPSPALCSSVLSAPEQTLRRLSQAPVR